MAHRDSYNTAMVSSYLVPAEETRVEIRVKNSRFIATAAPVFTVEQARAFIQRIKEEFSDATHNVPAYLVGHGASVTAHCNDDGEPSGTAGRPALAVLKGSGLGDIGVVVTRYFGGTKLGTGGLVRAYGDAVREVMRSLPRAKKVPTHTVTLTVPYSLYERVGHLIGEHHGQVLDETFAAEINIAALFTVERFPFFQMAFRELSRGASQAEIIATNEDTIMPVGETNSDEETGKS